jgi:hypothetical protein
MRRFFPVAMLTLAIAATWTVSLLRAADDDKPEFTTKQVMEKAMKGGLCKKVASGGASADEKAELVKLFTALGKNKPPKGDADSWKAKTGALLAAAKDAAAGKDGAGDALGKAATCGDCHKVHK